MGLMAPKGLDKNEVNYRPHEQCSMCSNFYPLNSCRLVAGNISPDAVCDKYQLKERTNVGKDAQYYLDEHAKMGKT